MTKATAGLDIQPLSEVIGAEVNGIDLSEPLDGDTVAAITDAWHEHIVLLFRDQEIDANQQIAFAENFGDVGVRSRPAERRPEGADYNASIMLVSNVKKNGYPLQAEILYSQTCIPLTKSCRKIQKNAF